MRFTRPLGAALALVLLPLSTHAGQAVRLSADNWHLVPGGKEVDAIYGDVVVRNDKVVAVIGSAHPDRQLNLRINRAQGCVLDFTTLADNNDQLTVFHPHGFPSRPFPPPAPATRPTTAPAAGATPPPPATAPVQEPAPGPAADEVEIVRADGPALLVRATRRPTTDDPVGVVTEYTLNDGEDFLRVATRRTNTGPAPRAVRLTDRFFHEKPALTSPPGRHALVYSYDRYFGMAYGLVRADRGALSVPPVLPTVKNSLGMVDYPDLLSADAGPGSAVLAPGKEITQARLLLVGADAAAVQRAAADALKAGPATGVTVAVLAPAQAPARGAPRARARAAAAEDDADDAAPLDDVPLAGASVSAYPADVWADAAPAARRALTARTFARTDAAGKARLPLAPGDYVLITEQPGRSPVETRHVVAEDDFFLDRQPVQIDVGPASAVAFDVVDGAGAPSPAKVQFIGTGTTPTPDLGPDQRADGCRNLWFSVAGKFEVPLPPGDYYVVISRGPEYDAAWRTLKLAPGKTATIRARLPRVVDSAGWVSADFHNHTTLSGDNSTQVEGRLAALIAEGVEFAPATEHQRITSYKPYLKAMNAEQFMGTSDGIELTGTPLPLAHANAFPLKEVPRTQFGGGPKIDKDPRTQMRRLRVHDDNAEKLVQQNHPDIGWLVYDKDGDGKHDSGYMTLEYTDVIEVWAPSILKFKPTRKIKGNLINDRAFNWLQLLNQGYRLPGVANTDAHHCFHDSGAIRNWVRSATDDPAAVNEMDVVRAAKRGNVVMSSGPFLDVSLDGAGPGDDLRLAGPGKLKARVQCPNWFDVDRVQVLINGRPDPALNFTRATHPAMFGDGVVKFDQTLPVTIKSDAHVIVIAAGENSSTGPVMGEGDIPLAVSNPIYVDTDGDGFKPARDDTLGAPLPVKRQPKD
ncbi:MAG TPA: CehA/McbA family metallohydrolase [Tepidisphaeraceae bacterium]|nr:CehA/McbA family metallohydrolase [Tepidisphaeraceae bacterium]